MMESMIWVILTKLLLKCLIQDLREPRKRLLKDNNLLLWFATFALIAVVSCGVGIGGELIEENNTKSKDSFENKTTYKKKKWFNSPSGFNKRNSSSAKTK